MSILHLKAYAFFIILLFSILSLSTPLFSSGYYSDYETKWTIHKSNTTNKSVKLNIKAERTLSSDTIPAGGEQLVTLHIYKQGLTGFAKIEEFIPSGFTISCKQKDASSFTVLDNTLKFVWQNMPLDSVLIVSYNLKATMKLFGRQFISGTFYYQVNNEAHSNLIAASGFFVSSNNVPNKTAKTVNEPNHENNKPEPVHIKSTPPSASISKAGIVFKLQFGVFRNQPAPDFVTLFDRFPKHSIFKDDNGLTHYLAGNFTNLSSANDALQSAKNAGAKDVILAAFYNNAPISVNRAVQIINGK